MTPRARPGGRHPGAIVSIIPTMPDFLEAPCSLDPSPDDWFAPATIEGGPSPEAARAITVCRSCVIQEACAEWGITTPKVGGILGGMTETERARERRRRRENK